MSNSELITIGRFGQNGSILVKIDKHWSEFVQVGQKWSKLVRIGQNWPELARIGQNWSELGLPQYCVVSYNRLSKASKWTNLIRMLVETL